MLMSGTSKDTFQVSCCPARRTTSTSLWPYPIARTVTVSVLAGRRRSTNRPCASVYVRRSRPRTSTMACTTGWSSDVVTRPRIAAELSAAGVWLRTIDTRRPCSGTIGLPSSGEQGCDEESGGSDVRELNGRHKERPNRHDRRPSSPAVIDARYGRAGGIIDVSPDGFGTGQGSHNR